MSTPCSSEALTYDELMERYAASQKAKEKLDRMLVMYKARTVNIAALVDKYKQLEQAHEQLRDQHDAAGTQLEKAKAALQATKSKSSELIPLQGKLNRVTAAKDALAVKLDAAEAHVDSVRAELAKERLRSQQLARERDELASQATDVGALALDAQKQIVDLRTEMDAFREQRACDASAQPSTSALATELTHVKQQLEQMRDSMPVTGLATTQDNSRAPSADSASTVLQRMTLSSVQNNLRNISLQQGVLQAEFIRWKNMFGVLAGSASPLPVLAAAGPTLQNDAAPLSSCVPTDPLLSHSSSDGLDNSAAVWDAQRLPHLASTQGSSDCTRRVSKRTVHSADPEHRSNTAEESGGPAAARPALRRRVSRTVTGGDGAVGLESDIPRPPVASRNGVACPAPLHPQPHSCAVSGKLQQAQSSVGRVTAPAGASGRLAAAVEGGQAGAGGEQRLAIRVAPAPPLLRRQGRRSAQEEQEPKRSMMQLGSGNVKSTCIVGSGFVFATAEERARWQRVQQSHPRLGDTSAAPSTVAGADPAAVQPAYIMPVDEQQGTAPVDAVCEGSQEEGSPEVEVNMCDESLDGDFAVERMHVGAGGCTAPEEPHDASMQGQTASCSLQEWGRDGAVAGPGIHPVADPCRCSLHEVRQVAPIVLAEMCNIGYLEAPPVDADRAKLPCETDVAEAERQPLAEVPSRCAELADGGATVKSVATYVHARICIAADAAEQSEQEMQDFVCRAVCLVDSTLAACAAPGERVVSALASQTAETLLAKIMHVMPAGNTDGHLGTCCRHVVAALDALDGCLLLADAGNKAHRVALVGGLLAGSAAGSHLVADAMARMLEQLASSCQTDRYREPWAWAATLYGCASFLRMCCAAAPADRATRLGDCLRGCRSEKVSIACALGQFLTAPCAVAPYSAAVQRQLQAFWANVARSGPFINALVPPLVAMESAVRCAAAQRAAASSEPLHRSCGQAMLLWGAQQWSWPHEGGASLVLSTADALVRTLSAATSNADDTLLALRQLDALRSMLGEHDLGRAAGDRPRTHTERGGRPDNEVGSNSDSDSSASSDDDGSVSSDGLSGPGACGTRSSLQALAAFASEVEAALMLAGAACGWHVAAQDLIDAVIWPVLESLGSAEGSAAVMVRGTLSRSCQLLLQTVEDEGGSTGVAGIFAADVREALDFLV
jgi:hypothetical protein